MSRKRVHYGSRETGHINLFGAKVPGQYVMLFLFMVLVSVTFYTLFASTYFDNFILNIVLGFSPSWLLLGFIVLFVIGKPPGYFFDLVELTLKGNEFDPANVPIFDRHRWRRRNPYKDEV